MTPEQQQAAADLFVAPSVTRCSTMHHAIDRVKRHFAPHEPNTPRALLAEMLADMKVLCDLAIAEYERDTQADFNQWKHTSFGRKCIYVVGEGRAYECFLAGRNWRPNR